MKPLTPTTADDIFEALVTGYDAVPADQISPYLARLCLLLGCALGDPATVQEAVKRARESHLTLTTTEEFAQ